MTEKPEMRPRDLMKAVLRFAWGTDTEMDQATMPQEEAKETTETAPKNTKEGVQTKIEEARASIDRMRQSTEKLARLQPARNLDEALRQLTGGRR